MVVEKTIAIDLSNLIAYAREGKQGYEVVIAPRLGQEVMDKTNATILESIFNDLFSKEE